jgi:23S rRNA pseudouridine1911/1915/1917 synthase
MKPPTRRIFEDTAFTVEGAPRAVDRALKEAHPGASWNDVRKLVRTGKVTVDGVVVTDAVAEVRVGAVIAVRMTARVREVAAPVTRDMLVHVDTHVVVVQKPAGVATVPYGDERDTLDRLVHAALRKTARRGESVAPLGVVQRLDKETSGLIVFARTLAGKRGLQQQFREHSVHRRYVAIAHGDVASRTIRTRLVQNRGDGRRGSTDRGDLGREAVTHVRAIERLARVTLVECRLETGRTHQIRIHLAEAGHPLLGERVYGRRFEGELLPAPRVMLHAAELGFRHPVTGETLRFEQRMPDDVARVVERERAIRSPS